MARARPKLPSGGGAGATSFIVYTRVSTAQQGRSGLGLEAQQAAVQAYVARTTGRIVAEFQEVESGKNNDRPQLAAALAACRARRAVLLVAKIDRLARNTAFLLSVYEGTGEGGVAFCDLPDFPPGPMGKFILTLMAAVAELEAGMISARTKAALTAAKARGIKLGNPRIHAGDLSSAAIARAAHAAQAAEYTEDLRPYVEAAIAAGCSSLPQIGKALVARGVRAPSGGEAWAAGQVYRLLSKLGLKPAPKSPPSGQ
jgi:DNA invertase Pin-like site-specific DNA recombinase